MCRSSRLSVGVGVENTLDEAARPTEDPYDACLVPPLPPPGGNFPAGTCILVGLRADNINEGFPAPAPDPDDPSPTSSPLLLALASSPIPPRLGFLIINLLLLGVTGAPPPPLNTALTPSKLLSCLSCSSASPLPAPGGGGDPGPPGRKNHPLLPLLLPLPFDDDAVGFGGDWASELGGLGVLSSPPASGPEPNSASITSPGPVLALFRLTPHRFTLPILESSGVFPLPPPLALAPGVASGGSAGELGLSGVEGGSAGGGE